MDTSPVRIAIIDDHPLIREGIGGLIAQDPQFLLCGAAEGVADGLELVREHHPDVIIVDIGLQDGDGLDLTRRILEISPDTKILISSMFNETVFAEQAIAAGARGFIAKSSQLSELSCAIRCILGGEAYLTPDMHERLNGASSQASGSGENPLGRLSLREFEVFTLIGDGHSTASIAEMLSLSVKTVETHRAHIKRKLNLKRAHELKEYAIHWKLGTR